ncbi:ATP-binding cassette domain-containing protein [archaeon]|nr:MAG: ATP-binding cassette domain-containing protein [archaeon]
MLVVTFRMATTSHLGGKIEQSSIARSVVKPVDAGKIAVRRLHATTKLTQLRMLLYRDFLSITRDTDAVKALVGKNVMVGLLIGIVFYKQVQVNTPLFNQVGVPESDVLNISALIFFGMMYTMISNVEAIPYLVIKSIIFKREVNAFAYSVSPFWLSHTVTVIPLLLLGFLAFVIAAYFLVSFSLSAAYMFYFWSIMFLASLSSYYLAMFIAALTNDQNLSLALFILSVLFLATFAGYAIPVNDVSAGWQWATYVSYVRWAFEGLMVNQWEPYGSSQDNDGQGTVLDLYDFDNYDKSNSYWIMFLTIGIFCTLAYLALRPSGRKAKQVSRERVIAGEVQDDVLVNSTNSVLHSTTITDSRNFSMAAPSVSNTATSVRPSTVSNRLSSLVSKMTERPTYYVEDGPVDDMSTVEVYVNIPTTSGRSVMFKNISYEVNSKKILYNVSGYVRVGEMCALMGSSGAGKSTLLDILANIKTVGNISGTIYANHQRVFHNTHEQESRTEDSSASEVFDMRKISAYVMQDSTLYGSLTVYESVYFASLLRLPTDFSDKHQRVREILKILGLSHIANSLVGSESKRGISGGQKKRVSIGVEIVHLPDVIFLDEPTTGLDSLIAHEVIVSIYRLARYNRTMLCTIHQPSLKTFQLFHSVLLMSDGRVIYFGPTKKIREYFTTVCATKFSFDDRMNPADFVIAVASSPELYVANINDKGITIEQLNDQFMQSALGLECSNVLLPLSTGELCRLSNMPSTLVTDKDTLLWYHMLASDYVVDLAFCVRVLSRRLLLRKWRSWYITLAETLM